MQRNPWSSIACKAAWALVAIGSLIRIRLYLVNRSLWSDEARLTLNLISRSFAGLWKPLDWQQGAPVGFLMLEKSAITILGNSEFALRLIPLLAGIGSLVLFLLLAKKIVDAGAGLVGLGMMCFSKELIYYSSEVKQYSLDVLVALLILIATARCFEAIDIKSQRGQIVLWGIISAVLLWFSHAAVFVIAGTGLALIFFNRNRAWWIAGLAALLAAFSFAIDYFVALRPLRQSVYLHEFWQQGGFLPRPVTFRSIGWLWRAFFLAFRTPGGFKVPFFTASVFLIGAVATTVRKPWLAAMLILAPLIALGAAAADEYPYLHRLILFVLPMLFLVSGIGLQALWRQIPGPGWLGVAACSAVLFTGAVFSTAREVISPEPVEEIKPVLKYLKLHRKPGDRIFVYWAGEPALRYYAARYGIDLAHTRMGTGRNYAGFIADVQRLPDGTTWILISHPIKEDERDLLKILDEIGTRRESFVVQGAAVYRYELLLGGARSTQNPG